MFSQYIVYILSLFRHIKEIEACSVKRPQERSLAFERLLRFTTLPKVHHLLQCTVQRLAYLVLSNKQLFLPVVGWILFILPTAPPKVPQNRTAFASKQL